MKKYLLSILSILITFSNYAQNVGINTTPTSPPTNTLDINGTLRVRGGTPGIGKVLTSDVNGVGSWTTSSANYPRISYDAILALPNPTLGDMAYDVTFRCLRVYNGEKWFPTYRTGDDSTPEIALFATQGDLANSNTQVYSTSIATDANGNIYITGYFNGTASFGTVSITNPFTNYPDIFLAKYSSNGTLAWVQSAGGNKTDRANSVAVDASGNVYITGDYSGTATFGSISKTSVSASQDMFVAKYNSSGIVQWVQSAGGPSSDYGSSIVVDAAGDAYITGGFAGTATFGTTIKTPVGGNDLFVAKYTTAGVLALVQSAGGISNDYVTSIAVDVSGKIYVAGYYEGTTQFGAINKTAVGSFDIFVAKYDPIGASWLWVQSAGGTSYDYSTSIALDNLGYLCITGSHYGNCTFGSTTITSLGNYSGYIAKYDLNGGLSWVENLDATDLNNSRSVTFDTFGNIYVTGEFHGTANFDAITKTSFGNNDIFIAKYNANGNALWVQSIKTTINSFNNYSNSITVDASNNAYIAGSVSNTFTVGNFTKTVISNVIDSYIALIK